MTGASDPVDEFHHYFSSHINAIAALPAPGTPRHYRKILYVSVVDAMSKSVFPRTPNKVRVLSTIRRFSSWADGDRISLPHLSALLSLIPDPQFQTLRDFARDRLSTWDYPKLIFLDRDPLYEDVAPLWPTEKEYRTPIHGIGLEDLRHRELFYAYRNALVHEFRPPSMQIETEHVTRPFYMHTAKDSAAPSPSGPWYLSYPEGHFRTLCQQILDALVEYFRRNTIDPINAYISGIYMLEELNLSAT